MHGPINLSYSYILCIEYMNWECSLFVCLSVSLSVSTQVASPKNTGYVYILYWSEYAYWSKIYFCPYRVYKNKTQFSKVVHNTSVGQ